MILEIPLEAGVSNSHQVQFVQLGDNFCELKINYVTRTENWVCDIDVEGVSKIRGMMLLPECEISATHTQELGKFYFVGKEPTIDNLGQDNNLVWSDE